MHIQKWLKKNKSGRQREHLAELCDTSVAYFWQLAGKHRLPSIKLAAKLERATRSITPTAIIRKADMLPDLFKLLK
jgi:hypothetical protein